MLKVFMLYSQIFDRLSTIYYIIHHRLLYHILKDVDRIIKYRLPLLFKAIKHLLGILKNMCYI